MRRVLTVWMVATLAFAQSVEAAEDGRKDFIFAGSGTNTLMTEVLVKAFVARHPDIPIKILPGIGSTGGIKAVHKGKIALGLAARPLRGIEQTWNLKVLPYARTVVVFGANPAVPDDNLSAQDVRDIYLGKRSKWSDGSTIIVLAREEGDSGADILMKAIPGFKVILENVWRSGIWRIEYRDGDCNISIAKIKNALGWTDLGSIQIGNHKIKPLKFNGISPTTENMMSGKYPLYKELSFVYQEPLPEPLRKFFAFVKSAEGAEMMRKNGYVAIP